MTQLMTAQKLTNSEMRAIQGGGEHDPHPPQVPDDGTPEPFIKKPKSEGPPDRHPMGL